MPTQRLQARIDAAIREAPLSYIPDPIKALWPRLGPRARRVLSGHGSEADYLSFWFSMSEDMREQVIAILRDKARV